MYDIKPLEEQWVSYNKKRRRPFFILLILVLMLVGSGAVLNYKNISLSDFDFFDKNKSIPMVKINPSDVLIDTSITKLEVHKVAAVDIPITVNKIKPATNTVIDNNPMNPGDIFIEADERVKKPVKIVTTAVVIEKERPRKKIHFVMIDANSPAAYKEVESRFSVAPDPDDSLFLAKMYYNKGSYKKAAHWALQTNKLNGDIEESWLIFAKAKSKTGQKNEAIRVLSQYAKRSKSVKAKRLLKKLKK